MKTVTLLPFFVPRKVDESSASRIQLLQEFPLPALIPFVWLGLVFCFVCL